MNPPPLPTTQRKKPPQQNTPSSLLHDTENNSLYGLLGKKCMTLATGVAQLYLAKNPTTKWQKKCTGVCCFVKDNPKRSYFIRLYSLKAGQLLWEQEMYNHFKYLAPRPYFLTFDTDSCRAALNFADESEASRFKTVVEEKARQRNDKKQAATHHHGNAPSAPLPQPPSPSSNVPEVKAPPSKSDGKKSKKKKKAKFSKADISMPSGFQHVKHVGFNPNSGGGVNEVDSEYREFFQQAGITEKDMQDQKKVEFIYDFIEKQGGIEAVRQDTQARKGRAAPPPPPGRNSSHAAPPPPPSRQSSGAPRPPPPSRGPGKAPPPPNRSSGRPGKQSPRPPPPPVGGKHAPPPPPPQSSHGSVPPPPPPPTGVPAPPPPPPTPPSAPSGGLLSQIQQGTTLKSADSRPAPAPAPATSGRDALLEAIRRGKDLKAVSDEPSEKPVQDVNESSGGGGLADLLHEAIVKRDLVMHTDSESDDDQDDDDDDEWSD